MYHASEPANPGALVRLPFQGVQVLMYTGDGESSVPDGGGHALCGPCPAIAGGKDPRRGSLERKRAAFFLPVTMTHHFVAGKDVPTFISGDCACNKVCPGLGSNKDEQTGRAFCCELPGGGPQRDG